MGDVFIGGVTLYLALLRLISLIIVPTVPKGVTNLSTGQDHNYLPSEIFRETVLSVWPESYTVNTIIIYQAVYNV